MYCPLAKHNLNNSHCQTNSNLHRITQCKNKTKPTKNRNRKNKQNPARNKGEDTGRRNPITLYRQVKEIRWKLQYKNNPSN